MKSPPEQYHDDIARDRLDDFISSYRLGGTTIAATTPVAVPAESAD
jgi:hypothetical protein